jgi:hypothetical protein
VGENQGRGALPLGQLADDVGEERRLQPGSAKKAERSSKALPDQLHAGLRSQRPLTRGTPVAYVRAGHAPLCRHGDGGPAGAVACPGATPTLCPPTL